jgi:P27 family predicted phage terminase small subunit
LEPFSGPGASIVSRKAAPANLKLLNGRGEGRDSGGRAVPPVPKFVRQAPEPPEWLSSEALAEWERVTPGLEALDLLKLEDRAMLATYCETWSRYVDAVELIRAEGMTIENPDSGNVRRHPAVGIAAEAAGQLRSLAAEFGLTPASERHLSPGTPDDGSDDPFAS